MIEVTGGEAIDELAKLQPVAEAIFGRGRRGPDWFRRKLLREGVEPKLSAIAREGDTVRGYALLGRAPSLGARARGAGIGVEASAQGRGLGRALLEFVRQRALAAGCEAIEFLAEPALVNWYAAQGFVSVEEQLTLLALGRGPARLESPKDELAALATPTRGSSAIALGSSPLWSWIPEVWQRTPESERRHLELPLGRMWLTRENQAWLVHRVELHASARLDEGATLINLLDELRQHLAPTTPVLLYPCPAQAEWVERLLDAGFVLAQRAQLVRCTP